MNTKIKNIFFGTFVISWFVLLQLGTTFAFDFPLISWGQIIENRRIIYSDGTIPDVVLSQILVSFKNEKVVQKNISSEKVKEVVEIKSSQPVQNIKSKELEVQNVFTASSVPIGGGAIQEPIVNNVSPKKEVQDIAWNTLKQEGKSIVRETTMIEINWGSLENLSDDVIKEQHYRGIASYKQILNGDESTLLIAEALFIPKVKAVSPVVDKSSFSFRFQKKFVWLYTLVIVTFMISVFLFLKSKKHHQLEFSGYGVGASFIPTSMTGNVPYKASNNIYPPGGGNV